MVRITVGLFAAMATVGTVGATGCLNAVEDEGAVMGAGHFSNDEKAMTASCAAGTTVKGIDVSYYQSNINWSQVAGDGVKFAFIRVSDGANFVDSKFDANWNGAQQNGVMRGAYQFFRSNQDPVAQAELLEQKIGQLAPGDLPPVIDVETADGQSGATIARKVDQWLNHVQNALGVRPIVYTGPYFWKDTVGGADESASPLWIAHYGTSCPLVPPAWTEWTFHQHSDNGHVAGISAGGTDMNVFNGTMDELSALTVGGSGPPAQNPPPPPPVPAPPPTAAGDCSALDAAGGIIDDGDPCFHAGGSAQWLHVSSNGYDGDAIYTGTTAASSAENYGEWTLNMSEEGTYEIEVYVGITGTSQQADYKITHADGTTDAVINQDAISGWTSLGAYHLLAGANGKVRVNDNTGEHSSLGRNLTFDGMRLTRLDDANPSPPPPAVDPCPRVQVQGTGSSLNIRPQPNTTHAAVGSLHDGSIVDRLDTVQGQSVGGNTTWYKITDGQVTGFITAAYAVCHP